MNGAVKLTMEKVNRFIGELGSLDLAPTHIALVFPKGTEPCKAGSYFFIGNTTVTVLTTPKQGDDIVWPP